MDFLCAYERLKKINYSFCYTDLSEDFYGIKSTIMYMFLMYAISQEETVEKHLSICYYLYFEEPYANGSDSLIKLHLLRVLQLSPDNTSVLDNWVFGIYNGNPDCPFSDEELSAYHKRYKVRDR